MKVTITEARKRLPELVRRVKEDANFRVSITVHGGVAAELKGCLPEPEPGEAARRLKALMAELPGHSGRQRDISDNVNENLCGKPAK